jgi:hypothetical protein
MAKPYSYLCSTQDIFSKLYAYTERKLGVLQSLQPIFSLSKPKRNTMKKVLVTLLVAGSMIAGTSAGFAATTAKPTIKPAAPKASSKEGTATHEMSENSTTQKTEAK